MALYIGTNYHPHDWDEERWKIDINLMKQAGFTTVRLGHLCWDSYEPEEGVYSFEWFDKVMDLFAEAEIGVVLNISTRPAPIWVHKLCPGCNIHGKSGNSQSSVRRYMEDVDDPAYQFYALRFARILVNRYKDHPALFAFGLCNELGAGFMSFSEHARLRFQNWLKKKYKTIDVLNKAWATARWSRKLTSFDDVVLSENEVATGSPEARLDMRRFFSDGIGSFIVKLKEVVSENAPGIPHSSNHYSGSNNLGFDYLKFHGHFVDYPGVGFYPTYELDENFHSCNTVYKMRQAEIEKPMWFLEFQTGRVGVFCGPKGFMRMHILLCLMNRGQMFLGWTWRTMLGGEEKFYHGLLGHDGIPTPNYYEYQQVASDIIKLQEYAFPYIPKPEFAVAYNQDSWWVAEYQKEQFQLSHSCNSIRVHQVFYERNLEYNVCDLRELKNKYKVIIIPQHILLEQDVADSIRYYVEQGGIIIMTGYSGTVDETGKAFPTPKPGRLDDVFGIRVAGFYRTDIKGFHSTDSVISESNGKRRELLSVNIASESFLIDVDYYEHLELKTAKCFASFEDRDLCAVSVNQYGKGTAYYVATETNQTILGLLLDYLIENLGLEKGLDVPEGVQARKIASNQYFYINTTDQEIVIPLEKAGEGILTRIYYEDSIILKAFDGELIVSE